MASTSQLVRLWTALAAWHAEVVLALLCGLVILAADSRTSDAVTFAWVAAAVVANVVAIATRRRSAVGSAVLLALVLAWTGLRAPDGTLDGWIDLLDWVVLVVAYTVGVRASRWPGLGVVLLLAGALQCSAGAFNPLFEMVTLGPWIAGRAVCSRRRLNTQIAERNRLLDDERPRFVAETVRLERALIARELHDLVAHNVTVVVIQATAGQRLAARGDAAAVSTAFAGIEAAAARAQGEVGRLAAMLHGGRTRSGPGIEQLDVLLAAAAASGSTVNCTLQPGLGDVLSPAISHAVYRVAREALANAMKHAPGAAVDVSVGRVGDHVQVSVVNDAAATRGAELGHVGARFGLAGMRATVEELGGDLRAEATDRAGWRVDARLPLAHEPPAQSLLPSQALISSLCSPSPGGALGATTSNAE